MSLIRCPECGREISDKASSCPGCGCPVILGKTSTYWNDIDFKYHDKEFGYSGLTIAGFVVSVFSVFLLMCNMLELSIIYEVIGFVLCTCGNHSKKYYKTKLAIAGQVICIIVLIYTVSFLIDTETPKAELDNSPKEVVKVEDDSSLDIAETETELEVGTEQKVKTKSEEPLSIAEQTIYDENGIIMKITGLEEMSGNYLVDVYIENNSELNFGFMAHSYAVNGIMTRDGIYALDCDVAAGKKANDKMVIASEFLKDNEIETIKNINVLFWAYDNDGLMKELDTGQIMISTSADDGAYDTISGQNLYDDGKIAVDYLYCDGDEYFYCLTNKTDEYFNFDVDNTSVNDFTMSGIDYDLYDEQVLSGCQIVYSIKVGSGFLEDNGLDAVRKIEYNFKIRTREDWFSEYSTGTVCHEL